MSVDIKTEELNKALERIAPTESGWLVKSYQSDFEWLWGLLSNGKDALSQWLDDDDSERNLVIIWDSMPDDKSDGINILDHLTPYDWALSFSYQQLRECAESLPKLRILIIDLYSHHQANALSVKMLPAFCHAMPWMQVFRPLPLDDKYALTLCDLVDWAKNLDDNMLSSTRFQNALNQLEPVVDAWVGNVSRGSDHHAIANLLAPRLLLSPSEKSEDKQEPAKEALSHLVENLGLLPHQDQQDNALLSVNNPWIDRGEQEWSQKLERLGNGNKLKLLLLDDQWEDGWGEVICKAVGVELKPPRGEQENEFATIGADQMIQVKACESANWLFEKDKPLSGTSDQRFKLRLDDEGEDCQEILFLDLRLFSRKKIKEEAGFFQTLLDKARKLNKKENLPWEGFTDDELERIKIWINDAESRGREDSVYHEALTLLPRIISLIDLSYPVILFSSTGQRKIVGRFKEYGNIITNFDKPRLVSVLPGNIAAQTAEQFAMAINKAVSILVARDICALINASRHTPVSELTAGHKYVELFIEESFSKNQGRVSVGGIFSVYGGNSLEESSKKADKFDNDLVKNGVRYFDSLEVGVSSPKILSKKTLVDRKLTQVMNDSKYSPDVLGAIRINHFLPYQETADILDPSTADNLYRLAFASLIELFLFEVLPQVIGKAGLSQDTLLSIYTATRVKGYEDTTDGRSLLDRVKYRFGFESRLPVNSDGHLMYSIGRDSIFPVVADFFAARSGGPNIDRAIGVKLCYQDPGYDKFASYPEYFVCRGCKKVIKSNTKKVYKDADAGNRGRIKSFKKDKGIGWFQPLNDQSTDVFHHFSDWKKRREFDVAEEGSLVEYERYLRTEKGYQAKGVSLVDSNEAEKIENSATLKCAASLVCDCENPDFAPDYRALHYVADEVLGADNFPLKKKSPYKKLFQRKWVFADELNDSLKMLMIAGRNLDSDNLVDAVVVIASALASGLGNDIDIKRIILARIGSAIQQIGGDDFIRISSKLDIAT